MMRTGRSRGWIALALAGGGLAAAWPALPAAAQGAGYDAASSRGDGNSYGQGGDASAARRVVARRTARILAKAQQELAARNYDEAERIIDKIYPARSNPYELALAARVRAYIAYGRGDSEAAVRDLRETLGGNALPRSDRADVLFQMAQIQASQDRWQDVVDTMKAWFGTADQPGSHAYFLLGLAYYELKDLDSALGPARKAVELADSPQQSWLQLVLTIHLAKQDYAAATPVLLDLLSRYPDAGKNYWLQLSTLYGIQKDVPRALAVVELAYRQGLLNDDHDLRRLAELSLSQGLPLRAATLVEAAIDQHEIQPDAKAYELVANSWILARESARARPSLERAAELSPTGDLYVRLGQVSMLGEDWDAALQALQKAKAKGGLQDPSHVELLLGIAEFSAHHVAEARTHFARAKESEKSRAAATSWLQYIEGQRRVERAS